MDSVDTTREPAGPDGAATGQAGPTSGLKRGAVGVLGMVTMAVLVTAPLTVLSVNFALSFALGAGAGTVGVIVIVAGVLAIFTAGYLTIARKVVNSGAYYAYIEYGLGRATGAGAAFIATVIYNAAVAAFIVVTGYFIDLAVTPYLGVDLPWWLYSVAALIITGLLGYFGVSVTARVTAIVGAVQFCLVIALLVAVARSADGHFTPDIFAFDTIFAGNVGLSIVFVLASYAGYEASAVYSEEARDAHKQVARATYIALGALTLIFVAGAWGLVAAVENVTAAAQADPGSLVMTIMTTYLGGWLGPALGVLVALSVLGAAVAFHGIAARYLFALGRTGLLPGSLSHAHPRRGTPHRAVAVQIAIAAAVLIPFAVTGLDPLTSLVPAVTGVNALGLITLMTLCSASVLAAAANGKLDGSRWSTRIAPAISVIALAGCGVLITLNFSTVTGSDSTVVNLMPLVLPLAAAFGAVKARRRARHDKSGRLSLAVE